jgi:hypothetical protein
MLVILAVLAGWERGAVCQFQRRGHERGFSTTHSHFMAPWQPPNLKYLHAPNSPSQTGICVEVTLEE